MRPTNRRRFLASSLAALGAATFLRRPLRAAPAPAASGRDPGFRIFACDWTMGLPCDPAAFAMAGRIGLDGLQVEFGRPATAGGPLPLFAEAKQDQILAAAADHSVAVASLALGAVNRTPYKSSPEAEQWVRAALDATGYRGWLGIEGLKLPLGIEPSLRHDLDHLRPIFPRTV